jgi:hypothetical protein
MWWACFLLDWNGRSFFHYPNPSIKVYSDAAGSFGCGAFEVDGQWLQLQWPPSLPVFSIAVLELIPIFLATGTWGPFWQQAQVHFYCDNAAAVVAINKRYLPDQLVIHLLRCLAFFAAYYQFQFSAEHVPGSLKSAADALSRNNINIFLSLAPQVSSQSPVSDQLKHLLLSTPPVWGSPDWTSQFRACLQEVSPPQQQTLILLDGPDS